MQYSSSTLAKNPLRLFPLFDGINLQTLFSTSRKPSPTVTESKLYPASLASQQLLAAIWG